MSPLRVVLWISAASQLVLGGLTLFIPSTFFAMMGLSDPPPDNQYMLGMLGARFLVLGIGLAVLSGRPRPDLFWVWAMVAIQLIDLAVGIYYTAIGVLALSVSAFPMFNAVLLATSLAATALHAARSLGSTAAQS